MMKFSLSKSTSKPLHNFSHMSHFILSPVTVAALLGFGVEINKRNEINNE